MPLNIITFRKKVNNISNYIRKKAAFIGITEQNLSLLKSGKVKGIRFDTLAKICEAMECQPGDIISWEPDPATPDGE